MAGRARSDLFIDPEGGGTKLRQEVQARQPTSAIIKATVELPV